MPRKQNKADLNLDPSQYAEMNRRFFADPVGPSRYLTYRMRDLMLGASASDLVKQAVAEGVTFQELTMVRSAADDDLYEPETISRFVAMDATVLLHHAAESLMRLCLAVADGRPCPWLEIGRLRLAGDFKEALEDFLQAIREEPTRQKVRRVFDGWGTHDELKGHVKRTGRGKVPTPEVCDDAGRAVDRLLVHGCNVLLNDAGVYNAAKHGLAVLSGEASAMLGDGEVVSASGPSLTYLEIRDDGEDGERKWNETTAWVKADRSLALVQLMVGRMDNAWGLARVRYLDAGGFRTKSLAWSTVDGVLRGDVPEEGYGITVEKMHMQLAYLNVPPAFGGV